MKKSRKILSLFLTLMMLFALIPANVSFAKDISSADISGETSDIITGSDTSMIDYVCIEKSTINTPETQNIVVGLNIPDVVTAGKLTYESGISGDVYTVTSERIIDDTVVFSFEIDDSAISGLYTITEFTYILNGNEYLIQFNSDDKDNLKFGVNQDYSGVSEIQDEYLTSENIEMEIVTIDQNGETTSVNTIEEAIDSAEAYIESSSNARSKRSLSTSNVVVMLDPGHDARHTGASGNGLREEALTLKIAKYCKAELNKYNGVTVYMTRETEACPHPDAIDAGGCNEKRVAYAKSVGASIYVSIHINSEKGTNGKGTEVYYPNKNYNSSVGSAGEKLAQKVVEKLAALGLDSRGIKIRNSEDGTKYPDGSLADYYGVIRNCKKNGIPAILIEHAFISNSSDAAFLKQESNLKALGVADATAIAQNYGLSKKDISVSSITVQNQNDSAGTFQVKISGINSPAGVTKVEVPIWSESGGQDDLKWYTATKQSDNSYLVNVNIANHKYDTGTYKIHVYITDGDKAKSYVGQTSCNVKTQMANISATDTIGTETQYKLQASGVFIPNLKTVQFAVWSETGGQDDLKWYNATKDSSGNWSYNLNVNNHKGLGKYIVHVYAQTTNGKSVYIGATSFTLSKPTASSITVQNQSDSAGTFQVKVSGINSPSGITKVEVPIWSTSNQSDLVWYTATKQSDGSYLVNANIANHKYNTGTYIIHVYITDGHKSKSYVGQTSCNVKTQIASITAKDTIGTETQYRLQASGVFIPNLKTVQFAVWSETGGQDDLKWYNAAKDSSGNWSYNLNVNNHKGLGEYIVHVYAQTTNGKSVYIGATSFTLSKPTASSITVQNQSDSAGTFQVKVSGINSPSGITKVEVPIWSTSNQSDLVWYTATKQSDGSYLVNANIANHKYNTGTYIIHVYITDGHKIKSGIGATSCKISDSLYKIMGKSSVTVDQMVSYYNAAGHPYPSKDLSAGGAATITEFCQIYLEEANAEGVKAEVAFCQAMEETGYLQFAGAVNISQFNFCGLGATGGSNSGVTFPNVRTGVRAHIQHLKAYASKEALVNTCVDPRFKYVTRGSAEYVEWLGQQENPKGLGWATAKNYGYQIVEMINNI